MKDFNGNVRSMRLFVCILLVLSSACVQHVDPLPFGTEITNTPKLLRRTPSFLKSIDCKNSSPEAVYLILSDGNAPLWFLPIPGGSAGEAEATFPQIMIHFKTLSAKAARHISGAGESTIRCEIKYDERSWEEIKAELLR